MKTRSCLSAAAIVGCALLVSGTWQAVGDDPVGGVQSSAVLVALPTVDPWIDEGAWPQPQEVGTFTQVATGSVYVEVPSADIVWRGPDGQTQVIGQLGHDAPPAHPGWLWGDSRDVVGDPARDLVAWVERVGTHVGQVVVVRASTGEQLARTELKDPLVGPVVIASVDGDTVNFAALDVWDGVADVAAFLEPPGDRLWTWAWASGQAPYTLRSASQHVLDVDGSTWAVGARSGIEFFGAFGDYLSKVPSTYSDRTSLGSGLSPGGRFWYGPAHGMFLETRTGARRPVHEPPDKDPARYNGQDRWGWTGPSTMTFFRSGLWYDCDAETGACTEPSEECSFVLCNAGFPTS